MGEIPLGITYGLPDMLEAHGRAAVSLLLFLITLKPNVEWHTSL